MSNWPPMELAQTQDARPPRRLRTVILWGIVVIALFWAVVAILVSLVVYKDYKHDQHLLKIGRQGQALVTAVHTDVLNPGGNNQSGHSIPPAYDTIVSYALLNVPGYNQRTFTSDITSQKTPANITVGEQLPVIYDPKNPLDNKLKLSLQNSSSSAVLFIPWIVIGFILLVITIPILWWRRRVQRNRAIEELQA